jgi:hypothetical protein
LAQFPFLHFESQIYHDSKTGNSIRLKLFES